MMARTERDGAGARDALRAVVAREVVGHGPSACHDEDTARISDDVADAVVRFLTRDVDAVAEKAVDSSLAARLRGLGACDSRCEGRCGECPDEVAREGAEELDRLRAENRALRALVSRVADAAASLARETEDPGVEALCAIHCARNLVFG